jgi:hypothetical protein
MEVYAYGLEEFGRRRIASFAMSVVIHMPFQALQQWECPFVLHHGNYHHWALGSA